MKEIAKNFEDNLSLIIASSEYVKIIEKFNTISLDGQVEIMIQFREYLNNMYSTIVDWYGEEKSQELRNNILDMLLIKLEEYY